MKTCTILTTNTIEFNSSSVKIDSSGGDLVFTDTSNPGGLSLSTLGSTPAHNALSSIQGGSGADGYYHLTATQHTGLTGGSSTSLHSHSTIITQVMVGKVGAISSSMDGYFIAFAESSDENFPAYVANRSATIQKLTATMNGNAMAGADSVIITLRKNHEDTAITVQLDEVTPQNTGTTLYIAQEIMASTFSVVNGDKITVRFVSSTANTVNDVMVSFDVTT